MRYLVGCAVRTKGPMPNLPVRTATQPLSQAERNPVGAAHGRDPFDHSTPIRGHGTRRLPTLLQTLRTAAKVALYPTRPHRPMESAL